MGKVLVSALTSLNIMKSVPVKENLDAQHDLINRLVSFFQFA